MRLGVFGGSFDPLHLGHLIVADDAAATLSLDRVLFVPAGQHPFKSSAAGAPADLRGRMVEESISGSARFGIDRRELERAGPSYTVETLEGLRSDHAGAELFLLVGSDILGEIEQWHRSAELPRLATVVALARAGVAGNQASAAGFVHRSIPVTGVDISSTEVRRRVRLGEPYRYLVPDPVYRIIVEHSLYRETNQPDD